MLGADEDVVDVGRLERQMVESVSVAADAEERMVIHIVLATVEPIERADDIALLPFIDVVRATKPEGFPIPPERFFEFFRHDDEVTEALDVRRAALDPEQLALAPPLFFAPR